MLAGALFYVAVIALVAVTILSAGMAMTRATIARMAQPYVTVGSQRAVNALEGTLSADVQAGRPLYPAPTFTPLAPQCADTACNYTTSETIALTNLGSPSVGSACDTTQSNCAPNVQQNAYVDESRLTAQISVTVSDARGNTVAIRSGTVIVRTFSTPPYVAIAGTRDGSFDDVAGAHTLGDDGGAPPATPNPCAGSPAGTADDTTVRVAYQNSATLRCTDGSAWGAASYSSRPNSSGWSP